MDDQQKKTTTTLEKQAVGGAFAAIFSALVAGNYLDSFASQEERFVTAAENGQIENMDRALEKGADIEDWAAFNALSAASKNGEIDAVQHLITLHNYTDNEVYRAAAEASAGGFTNCWQPPHGQCVLSQQ